jgi:hypothetical protein
MQVGSSPRTRGRWSVQSLYVRRTLMGLAILVAFVMVLSVSSTIALPQDGGGRSSASAATSPHSSDAQAAVVATTGGSDNVYFEEAGIVQGTNWSVDLNGSLESEPAPTSINFVEVAGAYPFTIPAVPGYISNVSSGTVNITSGFTEVNIDFTPQPMAVTFVETGLPASELWSVSLNEVRNGSATTTIGFSDPPGSYHFEVGDVYGYVANVTSGTVVVHGTAVTVYIGFSANTSFVRVIFSESGLPSSTYWTVTLASVLRGSSNSTIAFTEPNGSYAFVVNGIFGYSARPSSGAVDVNGAAVDESIVFASGTAALSVVLTASPSSLVFGNSTTLTATTSNGTSPFTYVYTGLPSGCTSENASTFTCTPRENGSFSISVTVKDAHGVSVTSVATLTVSGSGDPPSGGISTVWIVLVVVLLLVIIIASLVVVRRRHRSTPASPTPTSPPSPPPPR